MLPKKYWNSDKGEVDSFIHLELKEKRGKYWFTKPKTTSYTCVIALNCVFIHIPQLYHSWKLLDFANIYIIHNHLEEWNHCIKHAHAHCTSSNLHTGKIKMVNKKL